MQGAVRTEILRCSNRVQERKEWEENSLKRTVSVQMGLFFTFYFELISDYKKAQSTFYRKIQKGQRIPVYSSSDLLIIFSLCIYFLF